MTQPNPIDFHLFNLYPWHRSFITFVVNNQVPVTSLTNDEDRVLFSRIAEGDEEAFRQVFARYGAVIHPFVLSIVKQDAVAREIVQEVFLRVWLKKETLTTIDRPGSWLYRIASNLSINQLKRSQLEASVVAQIGRKRNQEEGADTLTTALDGRELRRLIDRAIDALPPQRKKVFALIREQGLSRREAAEKLNISENTVKSQLAEALRSIQAFIEQSTGTYIPIILLLHCLPH